MSAAAIAADDPRKEIKELLPHREPFLFVDKVEIADGKIVAPLSFSFCLERPTIGPMRSVWRPQRHRARWIAAKSPVR